MTTAPSHRPRVRPLFKYPLGGGKTVSPPWIILRRRDFRAGFRKNSAVEMVPTAGKILRQNRVFPKIPDLSGKKPCNLEPGENAQKPDPPAACPAVRCPPVAAMARKLRGVLQHRKTDRFFLKNREILAPVLRVKRRETAGSWDHRPDARRKTIY